MFNIGFTEMLVIAALALIFIGPKQLPEIARTLGRLLNDLKRSTSTFTDELKSQVDYDFEEELRKRRIALRDSIEKSPTEDSKEEKT